MIDISLLTRRSAQAAKALAMLSTEEKNNALLKMADKLEEDKDIILAENARDVKEALAQDYDSAFIDRLTLTPERITDMVDGLKTVASLDDPVGQRRDMGQQDSGIQVDKVRVPLGVICMIYEARPNVTADAAALCLKSGNAVILRGGKEALRTSLCIANILQEALVSLGIPKAAITVVPDADRALLNNLLTQEENIDLVIPRGGEGLIRFVTDNSKIPVIQHFKGVCHLYVDKEADLTIAADIVINGKTQRPGVCNALECVLIHRSQADTFLPQLAEIATEKDIKIHACENSAPYFPHCEHIKDTEFGQEYLSLELAVRIVDDFDQAVSHIDEFGSKHTEVICTTNQSTASVFQRRIDASVVMTNASSRFSDGSQLGLGAEIGIATTKLHAYGPMGLESLTTEKFIVTGEGQVRA